MLRKVESTSDINRGPEPYQSGTALTFPVLCLAYTRVVCQIDGAGRAYAHDDHYLNLEWSYLAWHSKKFSLNFGCFGPWTFVSNNINARYMSINSRGVGDVMINS